MTHPDEPSDEYDVLAARLREKRSDSGGQAMLDFLQRKYTDPASRLKALKHALRQLGVSDAP